MMHAKPSAMTPMQFVAVFGGVYEHTPEIAAATHRAGLTTLEDSAQGLAAAMAKAAAGLDKAAKLALIEAHPDLAGRLAMAGGLTQASKGEQGSAGLDQLSLTEHAAFTALNQAYRTRFGFPFIMAVKGRGKAEILAAFQARLLHGRDEELATALAEIDVIARLRLRAIFETL